MTKEEAFKRAFITQANRWPNADEIAWWKKSGMEDYSWVQQNAHFPMKEERDSVIEEYRKYRERAEAEMAALSSSLIQKNIDLETAQEQFETERKGWKQVEDSYLNDKARLLEDHAKELKAKELEIEEMQKHLDLATQNAKEPSRWSWQQHLAEAIRQFFGKGGV